ncbi:hypothetical protein [Rhodococcus wratislaviensis]|uniref:hypothetical protein n=1 Tax=Rhodococcus wratislaviensis TaxID=44752 RepID=UPI003517A620
MRLFAPTVVALGACAALALPGIAAAEPASPPQPTPAKPAARPATAPTATQQDPLTALVCTLVSAYPGGLSAVEADLTAFGAVEHRVVSTVALHVPGVEQAYTAIMTPINAHVTAILGGCRP